MVRGDEEYHSILDKIAKFLFIVWVNGQLLPRFIRDNLNALIDPYDSWSKVLFTDHVIVVRRIASTLIQAQAMQDPVPEWRLKLVGWLRRFSHFYCGLRVSISTYPFLDADARYRVFIQVKFCDCSFDNISCVTQIRCSNLIRNIHEARNTMSPCWPSARSNN